MVNKRIYSLFIILCLFFIPATAQEANRWASQISYLNDIQSIEQNGNIIYSLTDGKLFSYNNSDESIEPYIKIDGGNTDIKHIIYSSKHKCLVITRSDANIELLYDDKSYVNIPDLKNTTQNIDKTINKVSLYDDYAYIATNFGFLTINLSKKEVKESGVFNVPFYSILAYENKLYAATKDGILYINLTDNVQDFNSWSTLEVSIHYTDHTEKDSTFTDSEIRDIVAFKNQLHFFVPQKGIFRMENSTSVKSVLNGNGINSMEYTNNDHLIVLGTNVFWDFEDINKSTKINIDEITSIIPNANKSGEYWASSSGNNLSLIKINGNSYEYIKRWIVPSGPVSNYPFSLTLQNRQLLVTGGGFYLDRMGKPASISIYKDSKWTNIYPGDISGPSGFISQDIVYAISEPTNQNHIFASSWGEGLYEFEGTKFQNRYDESNSTIEPIPLFNYRRVSGMVFDKSNNLWLLNSMVENIIKVRLKSGEWTQLYYPEIAKASTNPKNIVIDRYSNKWVTSIGDDAYLFIFNDNGTIGNTSDDKTIYISKTSNTPFVDQDGKRLTISAIYAITEDVNGNFWVGTDIGPFVVYSSSNIFSKNVVFNKIKIEKESGSNAVTGLLEGVVINAIAIDGANRKWIATQTSGVYLISADNQETLEHFTLDNSPLPSNNVISLAIDSHNGTVYIGTERGLMSYGGVATEGSENFSNVYAYPNPVRPNYEGSVTVTGLQTNSRVKITDLKGNLINEGRSLGGQYSWNMQNARGRRVDSGIYLVFGSSEDGSEGVVTKIMVVN
ncbi:hypothetical protein G7051_07275 [Dysgonomonas sp. HDW5B]|uniref:type IX secretion system anionic LPS delivery protein PorZ n=1 Tax=Dysgonomonas sp. HDW5B TaxID=2714927 RepID=UPI0014074FFA|nr:two-component regulator propeller domain-containing protein [Dysgonomonas sp. HDW5B]QIK54147.1 hypothetical protein G7051_07275 [Dysgonomonas sp. HDW5B]